LHRLIGEAAAPMPRAAPVMIATLLSILPMLVLPKNLCVEVLAAMITRWAWSVNSCNLPGHPQAWFLHVVCKQM
jgi:hypothetical protein